MYSCSHNISTPLLWFFTEPWMEELPCRCIIWDCVYHGHLFPAFEQSWSSVIVSCQKKLLWWGVKPILLWGYNDAYLKYSSKLYWFRKMSSGSFSLVSRTSPAMFSFLGLYYQVWISSYWSDLNFKQTAIGYSPNKCDIIAPLSLSCDGHGCCLWLYRWRRILTLFLSWQYA